MIVFVDGWEHAKRFCHRPELIANPDSACDSFEQAMADVVGRDVWEEMSLYDDDGVWLGLQE